MAKVKVVIVDENTLRLASDGVVGDIIDLREIQSFDSAPIIKRINEGKDEVYKAQLLKENANFEQRLKRALSEKELALTKHYKLIEDKKTALELEVKTFDEKLKITEELTAQKVKAHYDQTLIKLQSELDSIKRINELEKNEALTKERNTSAQEIERLKFELEVLRKNHDLTLEAKLNKQKLELDEELRSLENELNALKLQKSVLNVKVMGEELEAWCDREYQSHAVGGFDNCRWLKDNIVLRDEGDDKGTKADYIFRVYANEERKEKDELVAVCCEIKSESPTAIHKKSNASHLAKLDKDRIKKNCKYALLISELEWDTNNDPPIVKVSEYKDMYIVRPPYFISFLALIKSLADKYKDLIVERTKEEEGFKESQEILAEFESFKNTYLDKPLQTLEKDIVTIQNEAKKSKDAAEKILSLTATLINTRIEEIKIKIERFDIKRVARRVVKLP